MSRDDHEELEAALTSLGSFESLVISDSSRTIVAACMEASSFYAINLWCDLPKLADDAEIFLKGIGVVSYRLPANKYGRVSVGYAVTSLGDATSTIMQIAGILKISPKPQYAGKLIELRRE